MNAQVRVYVEQGLICKEYSDRQQTETLQPREIPTRPWKGVKTDLFTLNDRNDMVLLSDYSHFWEVDELADT